MNSPKPVFKLDVQTDSVDGEGRRAWAVASVPVDADLATFACMLGVAGVEFELTLTLRGDSFVVHVPCHGVGGPNLGTALAHTWRFAADDGHFLDCGAWSADEKTLALGALMGLVRA